MCACSYFALHFAAREGLSGITKSLLSNKAEPEAKTVEGQTPHALAVKYAKTTVAEIIKQFIETGSYEGVDAIALEAEDDEDAELMRELNDLEVQPTAHMATRVAEIRPPGYKEGDTSGKSGGSGGSGGSGVANNTPKPGAIKAPTKDEDVDGFGKVYVGNAPAPHQLQQGCVYFELGTWCCVGKQPFMTPFHVYRTHAWCALYSFLSLDLKQSAVMLPLFLTLGYVRLTCLTAPCWCSGAAKSAGKHTHNGPEVTTAPAKPEYSVPVKSNGSAKVVEPTQTYDSYDGLMGAKDGTEQYDNAEANTVR